MKFPDNSSCQHYFTLFNILTSTWCVILLIVRTGLEGPGLTIAQKIWYCIATVGGQYTWARLQSFSAFRRWGDSEQVVLSSVCFFLSSKEQFTGAGGEKSIDFLVYFSEATGKACMDFDTTY
jgi:hypothetical protein